MAFHFHSFYISLNIFHSEVSGTLSHNETGVIILAQFGPVVQPGATSTFHRAHLIIRDRLRECRSCMLVLL